MRLGFEAVRRCIGVHIDQDRLDLKAGDSLDLFLEHFPSVQQEQTIAVLELVKEMLAS